MDVFCAVLLFVHLLSAVQVSCEHHSFSISVPHRVYECLEGTDVTMTCLQSGAKAHSTDKMWNTWLFTARSQEHCPKGKHPRGSGHSNRTLGVEYTGIGNKSFSITLQKIKHSDQGKYCCLLMEFNKQKVEQGARDFIYLNVVPSTGQAHNGSLKCSEWSHTPSDDSVAEGLAIAACVAFILCLPLILMLVYRQRQTVERHRRAHELVRMDSEAQAHENPVFLGDSPQPKPRTVSQIMTRQSSETGRHLLSDPGTPFSPNIQGELFFPSQGPIPESPNLMD
ncbi:V-type immunoglobulin domain-containing suppressor of T-cell activation isoform X2 [Carassius auratus]|uniref:V-type immunoglobulin domain-containing suppressor of T-cell activation isoform X2 n=1 Tax=Carassius auratus TaxID=7957 RepID=UPI000E4018E6|nr:V-type immunoglobulin domain-containing suppressor of T-cell activation-like isoform X2 [Carassius auratus]